MERKRKRNHTRAAVSYVCWHGHGSRPWILEGRFHFVWSILSPGELERCLVGCGGFSHFSTKSSWLDSFLSHFSLLIVELQLTSIAWRGQVWRNWLPENLILYHLNIKTLKNIIIFQRETISRPTRLLVLSQSVMDANVKVNGTNHETKRIYTFHHSGDCPRGRSVVWQQDTNNKKANNNLILILVRKLARWNIFHLI